MTQSGKKEKKRCVSVILRILVAAGALYLVFRGEDLRELADIMLGLNLWLFAAALGLYWLGQVLFVLRWRLLLKVQSVDISIWAGLKLHLLGLFYNNCLPSSIGGDLLRAWYVTKHTDGDRRVGAALTVFVDRIIGLIGTLLIASIAYWLVPVEGGYRPEGQAGAEASGGLIRYLVEHRWIFIWAVIAVGIGFCAVWASERGREVLTACWQRVRSIAVRVLKKGITAVGLYRRKPFVLVCALGLTFICQGTCVIALWLLGRNLGMGAHIKYYFVFFPLSWILGSLPISIGGVGIMEGWLKIMFMKLPGVSSKEALAVALCQRLIWLIGSLPGLAVHLVGAHLPKEKVEFFVDSASDFG
ncbi:MAG: lysylphosphatidylglycerol synthase transmembrane domain-containing protein [Planctomycetota bacterium]